MSNEYCQSSSKLMLPSEKIAQAKKIIAKKIRELENSEDGPCAVNVVVQDDGVWFEQDEYFVAEHVAFIAQALLDELEIREPFVFSWAFTCSAPRIDEFGGGACALKRGCKPYWVDAHDMAAKHFENRQRRHRQAQEKPHES